ncbi:MAG TPA: HepT-like ribonuclease domain-containing protein, partial [Stellaceae bacterium]|nr:HepT-like ribonuclease domain-containing protein [Stellaceae bacterium]
MRHPERLEDYLGHIVEAIDRATGHLQPFDNIAVFLKDEKTLDAIVRNIEIIGEAVTQLIPDLSDRNSYGCHCERSEAISASRANLYRDCFVAALLAMTGAYRFL